MADQAPSLLPPDSGQQRPIRVGFYRYSYRNRGGDRMVIEYANHLARSGWEVTLAGAVFDTVFEIAPEIRRKKITAGRPGFLRRGFCPWPGQDLVVADIIHLALPLRRKNRVVYFAQADDRQYYRSRPARLFVDLLYRCYFRGDAPAIAVSAALAEVFRSRYGGRCEVVTNGINHRLFFPEPEPALLASKQGRLALFLMARGDHFRKGFDLALQVLGRLPAVAGRKLVLWVGGDPLPADCRFPFPVHHFGVVSDDGLRRILSSADLLFYPSRHEGFGLFPLEAMACGCPVLTTTAVPYAAATGGIVTTAVNDQQGLLRQLSRLLAEPGRLAALRRQATASAGEYDLDRAKEAFIRLLAGYLDQRDAPRH